MTTHAYAMTKTEAGNTDVRCSECGPQGAFPTGESVAAFVQVHDREHAVRRNLPAFITSGEIHAWLDRPEPGLWEPSFEEREGHVAVPLGYVCIDEALAAVAEHDCPALRRAAGVEDEDHEPVTLRILDEHGKASDHVVPAEAVADMACIIRELADDDRVTTAWYVRNLEDLIAEGEDEVQA